ncbi:hypothetical protein KAJ83_09685 [Marivibrio halodurans]|uniref:DUF2730 family protein n=1 Tax=Marivibrio halodurans TaxID=2039722 RepID=A0A8J7S255_9PROT|nr:hypothetical protein [Marivibrio halodurans]MBP5857279.1 hypothetical protein [Marivibrio halodurans]
MAAICIAVWAFVDSRRAVRYARQRDLTNDLDEIKAMIADGDQQSAIALQQHGDRIARLERDVENGPSRREIAKLQAEIHAFSNQLAEMKGEFSGVKELIRVARNQTDLMQQWLRDYGQGR